MYLIRGAVRRREVELGVSKGVRGGVDGYDGGRKRRTLGGGRGRGKCT